MTDVRDIDHWKNNPQDATASMGAMIRDFPQLTREQADQTMCVLERRYEVDRKLVGILLYFVDFRKPF